MKNSSITLKSYQNETGLNHIKSIEVWKSIDGKRSLSPETEKMLNESLFELWVALQEAMGLAALIGADTEQFREEMRQLVELVEPEDA